MARRRGGGGRQERTDSPASGGGVHRRAQQRGAPGAAQRAGLHPVAAGLQGRDAPRHLRSRGRRRRAPKARRQLEGSRRRTDRTGQHGRALRQRSHRLCRRDGGVGSAGAQRKESAIRPGRPETPMCDYQGILSICGGVRDGYGDDTARRNHWRCGLILGAGDETANLARWCNSPTPLRKGQHSGTATVQPNTMNSRSAGPTKPTLPVSTPPPIQKTRTGHTKRPAG